jgi:hypothetical protein
LKNILSTFKNLKIMLIESLLIKGAIVLFKAAKTKAVITKLIGHSITTHGVVATAATVGQACIVVGGIKLASDTVENLRAAINDLKNGNRSRGAQRLARVLMTVNQFMHIHTFADLIHDFALGEGISTNQALRFRADVMGLSKEIQKAAY